MAESAIVSGLLKGLSAKLASGTLQQLETMWGLRRELEKLDSTLKTIQSVLRDAEEKEVKDEALRGWLAKLKNAAYDAGDVLDEVHYEHMWQSADIHQGIKNKVNDFFSSHNPLFFCCKMARKVEDIVNKLDEIAAERSKFHLRTEGAVEERRLPWRETHSHVIESEVVGRRDDQRKIVEMLVSNASSSSGGSLAPRVLPIVGMGGLGKTTLAKIVYNHNAVITYFELRMWVCVSEDFNIPILVKKIILSGCGSGQDIDTTSMDWLQQKLKETINLKRYLLVLDDIWNEDPQKWRQLRDLLTFGGEGSVILVTTRSKKVATIVGALDAYRLAHMSEDSCWELFEQRAFPGSTEKRPKLVEIGKEISKRCRGLPLAANVIGSMMHLMTEEREWLNVLESDVWDLQDGNDGILSVLKLSYQQLPSHLKQCFAFCAIFPKDHEINKEQLIQLWMANGFIPAQERSQLEEMGEDIFKELASRSFFQDIKVADDYFEGDCIITTCKIHDLIHDLAQSIMSKDCVILNDEQLKKASDCASVRYLMIAKDTTSSTLNAGIYNSCKTLRTLVAPRLPLNEYLSKMQDPYSIWSNLRSLRVLDLQRSDISDVPISVNNLKHLRYLDLSYIKIETLPEAISQLFYLQTLKIEGCDKLGELPKGMKNMCNLRHVYNRGCDRLDSMPRGLDKLSHLQTLSMFVASKRAGSGGLAELEHLNLGGVLHLRNLEYVMHRTDAAKACLSSKKKIKSLVLEWGSSRVDDSKEIIKEEEILEALEPHKEIQNLRIAGYRCQQCPNWFARCHLLKKLEIRRGLLSDMPCFPSLTELRVEDCPDLCPANRGFFRRMTSLQKLYISSSDKLVLLLESEDNGDDEWSSPLQELTITRMKARMFSSESCLGIWKNLSSLESLDFSFSELVSFPDDLLRALRSLRKLEIDDCPRFTGGEGGLKLQHLTSLEDLTIESCDALHSVNLEGLHRLRDLEISYCSKLERLQGLTSLRDDVLPALGSLRKLTIEECESLTGGEGGLKLQHLTSLESLAITDCPAFHSVDLLEGLHRLRHLEIYEWSKESKLNIGLQGPTALRTLLFFELAPDTTLLPDWLPTLTGLNELQIYFCDALTALPDGMEGLTLLKALGIWWCPLLASLPVGLQQRLPHLQSLLIEGCPLLKGRCEEGGDYWHLVSSIPRRGVV